MGSVPRGKSHISDIVARLTHRACFHGTGRGSCPARAPQPWYAMGLTIGETRDAVRERNAARERKSPHARHRRHRALSDHPPQYARGDSRAHGGHVALTACNSGGSGHAPVRTARRAASRPPPRTTAPRPPASAPAGDAGQGGRGRREGHLRRAHHHLAARRQHRRQHPQRQGHGHRRQADLRHHAGEGHRHRGRGHDIRRRQELDAGRRAGPRHAVLGRRRRHRRAGPPRRRELDVRHHLRVRQVHRLLHPRGRLHRRRGHAGLDQLQQADHQRPPRRRGAGDHRQLQQRPAGGRALVQRDPAGLPAPAVLAGRFACLAGAAPRRRQGRAGRLRRPAQDGRTSPSAAPRSPPSTPRRT